MTYQPGAADAAWLMHGDQNSPDVSLVLDLPTETKPQLMDAYKIGFIRPDITPLKTSISKLRSGLFSDALPTQAA